MLKICFRVCKCACGALDSLDVALWHAVTPSLSMRETAAQSSLFCLRKPFFTDVFPAFIFTNECCLLLLLMNWIWEANQTVLTRHFTAVLCLKPLRTMVVFVDGSIWCFSTSTTLEMHIYSPTGSRKVISNWSVTADIPRHFVFL